MENIITPSDDTVNLVQITFGHLSENIFNYNIDDKLFLKLLRDVSKRFKMKYFSKKFKRYRVNNLSMEVTNDETNIYKQNTVSFDNGSNYIITRSKKNKVPYHQFPCTRNIHEITYVHMLTFRLHNRLFLNFEIKKSLDSAQKFKIFFNYNHDKNSDIDHIMTLLHDVMQFLQASIS